VPFSLYHASVGTYLQILPSIDGLLAKAEVYCAECGLPDEKVTGASLAPDMWPFARQVHVAVSHSAGAIAGLRAGKFAPNHDSPPMDFASLRKLVREAVSTLEVIDPAEINAMMGRDMLFEIGERRMPFTAEDFILTFSLPNFYFHCMIAYSLLRSLGVPVGKLDYLGKLRLKA
jgi:hypothetical protein